MPIELTPDQNAEPGQCGSCQFFRRRDNGDTFGVCQIKLPPWVAARVYVGERDGDCNEKTLQDTNGCSLHVVKNDGSAPVQFVRKQYWHAGARSR